MRPPLLSILLRLKPFLVQVFFLTLATGIGRLFVVVGGILVARVLGGVDFGRFAFIQSTVAIGTAAVATGLAMCAARFGSELLAQSPGGLYAIWRKIALGASAVAIAVTAAIFAYASDLSARLFGTEELTVAIRVAAVGIAATGLSACTTGILTAMGLMRPMALIVGALAAIALPSMWALMEIGGVTGACAGVVLFQVSEAVGLAWYCHRNLAKSRSVNPELPSWARLLSFAFPTILASGVGAPVIWLVNAFLSMSSGGVLEVGIFSAALQCFSIAGFIPAAVLRLLLPWFTRTIVRGGAADARRVACWIAIFQMSLGGLLFLALMPMGSYIASIYGADFIGRGAIFVFALAAAPIAAGGGVLGTWLNSVGRQWMGLWVSLTWGVAFIWQVAFFSDVPDAHDAVIAMFVAYSLQVALLVVLMVGTGVRPNRAESLEG